MTASMTKSYKVYRQFASDKQTAKTLFLRHNLIDLTKTPLLSEFPHNLTDYHDYKIIDDDATTPTTTTTIAKTAIEEEEKETKTKETVQRFPVKTTTTKPLWKIRNEEIQQRFRPTKSVWQLQRLNRADLKKKLKK
eukprot:CAMPEP_0115009150 /NCGR_PEP_ID=MMETSP0216-20121206/22418_1 /TAXON_ID=223996 /ORGANISM="Protocruzia adherens, Strain Boccale" /LENGTH=135 /DNA_ID=CAMNT_0002376857 /DNA_START=651 /DNA_END=1058 /DNA_ORIENTATION=-